MDTLRNNQSALSQWHELVTQARKESLITLTEDSESYLVFLLMRFMSDPEIAKSVLSIDYLTSLASQRRLRQTLLQDVGDKCLLMAGLFPARVQKKRVKISYFVNLGRSAYAILGDLSTQKAVAALYSRLSQDFVPMMDVLQTSRELEEKQFSEINLIDAYELWSDTKSSHAFKVIQRYISHSIPQAEENAL